MQKTSNEVPILVRLVQRLLTRRKPPGSHPGGDSAKSKNKGS
jgi:hypothetical protein